MKTAIKKIVPFKVGVKIRGAYQKFLGKRYAGDRYYCPFCEHSFAKLLPGGEERQILIEKKVIGAGKRNNMVCPRCYSTDRDRLLFLYLKHKTSYLQSNDKVLHIAPESSLKHLLQERSDLQYTSGDKFEEGYAGYYYDRDVIQMDVTDIPYENDAFDLVICNHVFEHLNDDRKAMGEILRVLKPGGQAIMQVPWSPLISVTEEKVYASALDREKHYGQFDHVRLYGTDYKSRLQEAGFVVQEHNPERDGWNDDFDKYAINPLENIYVGHKQSK